jgi:hypothetical protein
MEIELLEGKGGKISLTIQVSEVARGVRVSRAE